MKQTPLLVMFHNSVAEMSTHFFSFLRKVLIFD